MRKRKTKRFFFYCELESCKSTFHSSESKSGSLCLIEHRAKRREIRKVAANFLDGEAFGFEELENIRKEKIASKAVGEK